MISEVFLRKLKNVISESEYNAYLDSLNKPETHGFTINLYKLKVSNIDLNDVIKRYNAKLIYKNENYAYLTYDKLELEKNSVFPGKDPLHHVGLYYIQEPSASKVLYDVDIDKSDAVIDLCASPGGKSIETLYNLDKSCGGFLIANEIKGDRVRVLSSNIERMGFDNAIVTCNNTNELTKTFNECFDKVIVDAPCSGEGMFRKSEAARMQWSEALVASCTKTQREIFADAYALVKRGGLIIYSTCTFSKEEDEDNVDYFLNTYKNLKLLHMEKNYPYNSIGEGQFFAIIKKDGDNIGKMSFPNQKSLKGLNVLRYGIKLYEDNNGRKEPTHASTHDDKVNFDNVVELDDKEILEYLHGDVIRKKLDFEGWCKITYMGLGVGLGKVVGNAIKNHYPKGLRNV